MSTKICCKIFVTKEKTVRRKVGHDGPFPSHSHTPLMLDLSFHAHCGVVAVIVVVVVVMWDEW